MSETLVITLDASGQSMAPVLVVGVNGEVMRTLEPKDLPAQSGRDAVLVIPGEQVATHLVAVPDFPDAKLKKILPGILDDRFALANEDRHLALLAPRDGESGQRLVGVMDAARMQAAADVAQSLGLTLKAVVPDHMLLERPDEGVTAVSIGGRVLARRADGTGFAADAGLAEVMLGAGQGVDPLDAASLQAFYACATGADTMLLQGQFAPRTDMAAWLVFFRRTGVLAACALMLWVGATLYQATDNFSRADALYAQAEARFRRALPEVGRVVNMEAQMRRALQSARQQGGGEFLLLSGMAAKALSEDDSTMFESMRFDGNSNALVLNVTFASFAKGEAYKARLAREGLLVIEGSSRTDGARVLSELTIRRQS